MIKSVITITTVTDETIVVPCVITSRQVFVKLETNGTLVACKVGETMDTASVTWAMGKLCAMAHDQFVDFAPIRLWYVTTERAAKLLGARRAN